MNRRLFLTATLAAPVLRAAPTLALRRRTDDGPREESIPFDAQRSALILCDMWDRHWCRGANERLVPIIERSLPLLEAARGKRMVVIHAPSETMEFYRQAPQRLAAQAVPKSAPPTPLALADPPLPIDSAGGGCDTGDKFEKAWSRQHAGVPIAPEDFVTDKGEEVYSILKLRGIETLFVMGVHTNMCILNRGFAIKQMTKWGVRCVLVRDLTDAMYNPADRPQVSHDEGTRLVVDYIERHWCPSATSADLIAALG
ncbi:MAG: isochorismatase family protein [Acidobacteria bacterium]|nr:isochorismatase family protein [Acidobacteriota bacterium]